MNDRRPDWQQHANCIDSDVDMFYPDKHGAAPVVAKAKAICSTCLVKQDCLNYALDNYEQHGIWGGLTTRERRREAQRRLRQRGAA